MFGHDNDQAQSQDNSGVMQAAMPDPIPDGNLGDIPAGDSAAGVPAVPPPPDMSTPELPSKGTPDPLPTPSAPSDADSPTTSSPASSSSDDDDLMKLKQQALQHLSPLVSHLDQTPEEKFRTTMMMIQASDDKSLIKSAFEAAQLITDDKARAQALLDVINEINYFTQHQS